MAATANLLSRESNAYSWLRHTIEALAEGDSPEEFLEHTKLELFQDQVFCFTPKGKLIALPRGATPIDFAYAVHTNIGDTTVGAKINGSIMPLVTRLSNGDEVEIIRSGVQVPPAAWEEIVVTGKARAAIRRATRMAIRKQYAGLGHRILERTFERAGKIFSRDTLRPVLHRLGQRDVEDAIAAVGRGEMSSIDVLRAVYPDYQDERVTVKPSTDEGWFAMNSANGMVFKIPGKPRGKDEGGADAQDRLPIRGLGNNAEVHFSPAGAVPGDRIVGIMEDGKGITIYPIQASTLQKFDDEARTLDRRALGSRRGQQVPLHGSHPDQCDQRAGNPCDRRPDRRAPRHQYSHALHGARCCRFHRDGDRRRGLGPAPAEPVDCRDERARLHLDRQARLRLSRACGVSISGRRGLDTR